MEQDLKTLVHSSPFRNRSITATAQAYVRNPLCGDTIHLELAIYSDIITNVSFSSDGCLLSQAAISMLAQKIFNVSLESAAAISIKDLEQLLHISVGPTRRECIILAHTSLHHIIQKR